MMTCSGTGGFILSGTKVLSTGQRQPQGAAAGGSKKRGGEPAGGGAKRQALAGEAS